MIKTSGANVSPREVEAAIHDLTGLTAHVIGIADDARGQVVAAAVRVPADRAVDVDELREQLAEAPLLLQGAAALPAARATTRSRCWRAASSTGPRSRRCSMLADALDDSARDGAPAPGRPATSRRSSATTARITWAELDDASRALASRMVRAGLNKGDRVGLLMPNGIDWATAALAVMRVGAVLVPLSTLLRPPELLAQLRVASVSHLIAVRAYRGRSYLDDLRSLAPALDRVESAARSACPRCADLDLGRAAGCARAADHRRGARGRRSSRRRHGGPVHLGQPRRAEGRDPHPRERAAGDRGPGSRRAASAPESGCTSRCRSSGRAASAAGCSRC